MTVRCIDCSRFNLRGVDQCLARAGFGACDLKKSSTSVSASFSRECGHHEAAPAAVVQKRREWLENRAAATSSSKA